MRYFLTPQRFEEISLLVQSAQRSVTNTVTSGFESGAEQDGHHDEGYQLSLRQAEVDDSILKNLAEVLRNAEIVNPKEQNETVAIASGVIVLQPNGEQLRCVLEGYVLNNLPGMRISIHSPLGKAILGAKKGEKREVNLHGKKVLVTIEEILPPSQAENIYIL